MVCGKKVWSLLRLPKNGRISPMRCTEDADDVETDPLCVSILELDREVVVESRSKRRAADALEARWRSHRLSPLASGRAFERGSMLQASSDRGDLSKSVSAKKCDVVANKGNR